LKQAIVEDRPDDTPIAVRARPSDVTLQTLPLGNLRRPGHAYARSEDRLRDDAADTPANRAAIVRLVEGADTLLSRRRLPRPTRRSPPGAPHLTTAAAGEIAAPPRCGGSSLPLLAALCRTRGGRAGEVRRRLPAMTALRPRQAAPLWA